MEDKAVELKKVIPIGQATEDQIAQWKQAHPMGVYGVITKGRIGYFKHPSFKEMDYYHAKSMQSDSVTEGYLALTRTLWIGGDPELKENALYVPTVHSKLKAILFDYDAELVNL